MTAFDPGKSYLADHELHDFIETGDYTPPTTGSKVDAAFGLKVKRLDATDSGFESIALALGLAAESTALVVWMPLNSSGKILPFNPQINGIISLPDDSWTIDNFRQSRFGHWEMGVTKARSNASA